MIDRPAALYRAFTADGDLLYVGCSTDPLRRLYNHTGHVVKQEWWIDIASITLEHFATRDEAFDAEANAIADERPKYNGRNERHRRRNGYRSRWNRERIIDAIQRWEAEYGEPPAGPDWNPYQSRTYNNDVARARRAETARGFYPSVNTVVQYFGSWNAAITAAGFTPRSRGGGGGNQWRQRRFRDDEQAAA